MKLFLLEEEQNLGHKIPRQGGYHAIPPLDNLFNLRAKMVQHIEQCGIPVRYHHHEVGGPGQSEIEIHQHPLLKADHNFLLASHIFSEQLIESWIDHKFTKEFNEVRSRPHPYEMSL